MYETHVFHGMENHETTYRIYRELRLASDGRYIGFDNDGNLETSEHKLENIPHVSPERLRYLCFRTK